MSPWCWSSFCIAFPVLLGACAGTRHAALAEDKEAATLFDDKEVIESRRIVLQDRATKAQDREEINARRIVLRDQKGTAKLVMDADEGIQLLNAKGQSVCRIFSASDGGVPRVRLELYSGASEPKEGQLSLVPEVVVSVMEGQPFLQLVHGDKWISLTPRKGVEWNR